MQNKIVLITGGTGGIGKQTALALAQRGAHVVITGRNQSSGESAMNELKELSGNPHVDLLLADLANQSAVRSLAAQFQQKYPRLDVLINNAGLAEPQRRLTEDNIEAHFAVNVVTPYLLAQLLMNHLKASPSARVITLTGGDLPARLDLNNLQSEHTFAGLATYSQTKVAMMAVMYEFAQRTAGTPVTVNVCYPGQASTSMTQGVTPEMLPGFMRLFFPLFNRMVRPDNGKSAAKAARSSVYLASSSDVEGITGRYFNKDSKPAAWPNAVLDQSTRLVVFEKVEHCISSLSLPQ